MFGCGPGFAWKQGAKFHRSSPLAFAPLVLATHFSVAFRAASVLPVQLLGLTRQSSGLAYGQPLTSFVSRLETRNIQAHALFTGIHLLKRLSVGCFAACRASPFRFVPVSSLFDL